MNVTAFWEFCLSLLTGISFQNEVPKSTQGCGTWGYLQWSWMRVGSKKLVSQHTWALLKIHIVVMFCVFNHSIIISVSELTWLYMKYLIQFPKSFSGKQNTCTVYTVTPLGKWYGGSHHNYIIIFYTEYHICLKK